MDIYEFGEFRLDVGERRLSKGNESIPLAPKAHDVLAALVQQGGRLVTKQQLLTTIWPDSFVEEGILAVHVSGLRRALGDADRPPRYIATVSRSGYRFIAPVRRVEAAVVDVQSLTVIAVLPFRPLMLETRDAALEMGIADSLIAQLGKTEGLVVRPLSAVRKYADLEQDPVAAGRDLRVRYVLDGTIQHVGDAIRVTVRLLNVADGTSSWSGIFDERFVHIFSVEDAISRQVTASLRPMPTSSRERRSVRRHTSNSEAYLLFLKGRYLWERRTQENADRAIAYYKAALDKDPSYALAYVGLAACYATLPFTTGMAPHEAFPRAKDAVLNALEIDNELAEAHISLAGVSFWYEWNRECAELEFGRALELSGNEPSVFRFYGHFLSNTGRHDEALRQTRKALTFDPLSTLTNARLGQFLYQAGDYDAALDQLRSTLELDQGSSMVHLNLGRVYERKGMYPEAIAALRKACELSHGGAEAKAVLGYTLAGAGEITEARRIMAELTEAEMRGLVHSYNLALVSVGLRAEDDVRRHLENALTARDPGLTFIAVEPKWRVYHDALWFRHVVATVGLWTDSSSLVAVRPESKPSDP